MKSPVRFAALLGIVAAGQTGVATADLLTGLLGYYDFEEAGDAGLANKAPGSTGGHDGVRGGTNALYSGWSAGSDPTGPGFTGKVDFTSADPAGAGVSFRQDTLIGGALNLDDDRDEYVEIPIGSSELGAAFTVAAWHCLAPGANNASNRYHVFEGSNDYDISWGTENTGFNTVQGSYRYLGYVAGGPNGGFGPAGVATGVWQHVVETVTFDGAAATMTIYLNGEYFDTRTVAATAASFDFPSLVFGRARLGTGDRDWDGMIDEVGVWTRVLDQNDVNELYLRGAGAIPLSADLAALGKAFIGVAASDPAAGQVSGSDIYDLDATTRIVASAAPGYVFAGWSDGFAGQPEEFNHTVTGSVSAFASLVPDTADSDGDGLTNFEEETIYFTYADNPDSDGDQITDGDEVKKTGTDPFLNDGAAIDYILAHLCTGGISPGDEVLARDPGANRLSLHLEVTGSTHLSGWSVIQPGVSVGESAGSLEFTLPAASDPARFFAVEGRTTTP
ncbi:LamG domain-containing protein [Luteolibacter marinus]|uniref:LamG domain-containing protein n=1 Tax=Luteolibacter marinus TaxID=2776705 RepID=UPI0018678166|nr:LamG domain-containing protein [Luteolibacter marinus]